MNSYKEIHKDCLQGVKYITSIIEKVKLMNPEDCKNLDFDDIKLKITACLNLRSCVINLCLKLWIQCK